MTTTDTLLRAPEHKTSLATSALLVYVGINVWTGTKSDGEVADRVSRDANAQGRAGRWSHDLLMGDPDLKKVLNHRQTVSNWIKRITFDWAGKLRLLPIVRLQAFMAEYQQHEKQFNDMLEEFLAKYEDKVSDQAFARGEFFNRNDYPSVEELRRRFRMYMYTCEVPSNDFRSAVADDIAEDLRRNYERQTRDLLADLVASQKSQILDLLKALSHACTVDMPEAATDKPKRRKVYDSTLTRAIELCDTFAAFNPAGDTELADLRDSFWRVVKDIDLPKLRESDTQRQNVKDDCEELLKRFAA